jgi:hypothetical protein
VWVNELGQPSLSTTTSLASYLREVQQPYVPLLDLESQQVFVKSLARTQARVSGRAAGCMCVREFGVGSLVQSIPEYANIMQVGVCVVGWVSVRSSRWSCRYPSASSSTHTPMGSLGIPVWALAVGLLVLVLVVSGLRQDGICYTGLCS